jgi:hypothetical protein
MNGPEFLSRVKASINYVDSTKMCSNCSRSSLDTTDEGEGQFICQLRTGLELQVEPIGVCEMHSEYEENKQQI